MTRGPHLAIPAGFHQALRTIVAYGVAVGVALFCSYCIVQGIR